ncbi:MAG: hypothetical protein FWC41_13190, partial [Firmicutes bacterium]|nr:hypothetical protein [Bacillota bacterium]
EITPEMDISEIEAAWNEFLILSSKSNDQVVANAANAELQILQIRKQKLAEYQKIFEDYVNASRDGNDRIAELVRKNAEDEEKIRLGVNSLGEKLTDEDIANIKRKMALRDVAIAKEQEEIYKTTEAYKKLFTLSIQNKTAKYLKELLDWQRKIIASSKEITSGTKKGRFNVKYLMGLDDMEEVDISLELLQQKFENFNEIFVELGKKNPFIALKIGIEEIQRKDSILTPQQKKELELLTKDIKLDLTTDIVGGIGKLGEAFSGLDSNIGNIVSSFTTVISSIANASKSTASWGDKFNSIITIVVTLGTILYDLIVNFGTKRAMKDVETLNGIIKEVGNTIAANEKALDNFYRRNNIRLEQAKRSGQWNFDKFEEKSGMWDASTQEYENWKRRAYNRKELLDKERAALIEQMRLLKLQQAAYKAAETDKKDYKEEIANNQKQYDELLEKFDYMYADITDKLLGTGLEDAARNFGQIFADSVMEGIDYMDDFRKAFANMIKNLIIESFLLPKMANALSPMFEKIDKLIEEKGDLTEQDVIDIINMGDDILNNMAAYGEALRPLLERLREWTGGLSEFDTLQKGIQGITEQTAGVLESYLNQMRVSVDMLLQNSNFMNVNVVTLVTASSDMLYQMRESVQIQRSIYHLIDSVIAPVNSLPTGMAIKTASIIH